MVDRAGHRFLESQLLAIESTLEFVLEDPARQSSIVADDPDADLAAAAATVISHLEAARAALAPFFWLKFAVGDVVDVVTVSETTGKERTELANVTVVEIGGRSPVQNAIVEDARGTRHHVDATEVRRRAPGAGQR